LIPGQKKKVPIPLTILFGAGILALWFSLYWQMTFLKTYSTVKTEMKTKEIKSHGKNYYVDPVEYKKAGMIQWGGYGLFGLAFAIFAYYQYKKDPAYFRFFKKRDNRNS
jgi:hypothetical protein